MTRDIIIPGAVLAQGGFILRSVSVIGIGETKFGKLENCDLKDLIRAAGERAIEDAGIGKDAIQSVVMGNYNGGFWNNQTQFGALAAETLGLKQVPNFRVEGACASGSLAFRQAYLSIAAGVYDVVLVGGVEKMSATDTAKITEGIAAATDYEEEAKNGLTFPGIFAMIARRYMYEYGLTREELAKVPVQSHENGLLNEDAQMRKRIDEQKVLSGFPVADPLTVYDCSLVSDGAVFLVLCATERVGMIDKQNRGVEIIGSGHGGDTLSIAGKETITSFSATKTAAREAYEMARLTPQDIDFAEVHDCFSITQIINTEDLGFFPAGEGIRGVLSGETGLKGRLPINPSGGLKAKGHAIGATGLSQIYEVVLQLRGEAGERQVANASVGLTQNLGGSGAVCTVHIFRRSAV